MSQYELNDCVPLCTILSYDIMMYVYKLVIAFKKNKHKMDPGCKMDTMEDVDIETLIL